jgi:hypothetical protein
MAGLVAESAGFDRNCPGPEPLKVAAVISWYGLWMAQIARNVTDAVDGFFIGKRYLIHDRDPLYTAEFLAILAETGVQSVSLPPRSPNLNAYAERFVRTIKESCLERVIVFGETSLRHAVTQFLAHYHEERNHQGLDNRSEKPISWQCSPARLIQDSTSSLMPTPNALKYTRKMCNRSAWSLVSRIIDRPFRSPKLLRAWVRRRSYSFRKLDIFGLLVRGVVDVASSAARRG